MTYARVVPCLFMLSGLVISCSMDRATETKDAVEHGRDIFDDTSASDSTVNAFSCGTCHRHQSTADTRILPGADLAGVVERPTYWGGQEDDLLGAINHCRYYFMGAQRRWLPADDDAAAMFAFLSSLPATAKGAQPFTIPLVATDLPAGNAARGAIVFQSSCQSCHGEAHDGKGVLRNGIPVLPEESVRYFESIGFDATQRRVTFVEKVRHGSFLGLYGSMPPYSKEAMSDADLAALLAFLGLY